jgi:heme oxygenase
VFRTFEECWKEQMSRQQGDRIADILRQVWTPAMVRTDALTEDLKFFYGQDESKFQTPIMTQQIEFVDHIRQVTTQKPHLLLAYGHVMYLALFAGGRILRSNIAKAAGLFPQIDGMTFEEVALKGTNLFRFQVDDEESLRVTFKTRFELATRNALTEQEKRDIIDESLEIFRRNSACIAEIESKNRDAMVQKLGYRVVRASAIILLAFLTFVVFYIIRRLLCRLL